MDGSGFGDDAVEDTITAGDEAIDLVKVAYFKRRIKHIQSIEDPAARLLAAKYWAFERDGAA